MSLWTLLVPVLKVVCGILLVYVIFIALLIIPYFQNHVIYLHRWTGAWFRDLNVPEQWGFLPNQVIPFALRTPDDKTLYAWHVLPLELYQQHESELLAEQAGFAGDITTQLGFKLLKEDPKALLVLYFHGAGLTVAGGFRPASYRAISATLSDRCHVVSIDYRGFGRSSSYPSEEGLLIDAQTLADWATNVAGIPPERIVLYGQSLGTAVAISLAHSLALQPEPIFFAGMVIIAAFADVETLTATYRIAGIIPLLSPLARIPHALKVLNHFIVSKWASKDKLPGLIRAYERHAEETGKGYDFTFLHAQNDTDIPWAHTQILYWRAVKAMMPRGVRAEEGGKMATKRDIGAGGWIVEHSTKHGTVRQRIVKYGDHTTIQGWPVVSMAVRKAFSGPEDGGSREASGE